MRRDGYLRRTCTSSGEGRQGREAPTGSLDGSVPMSHSLASRAVGPERPNGSRVDLCLGVGLGTCLTVPYLSLREIAEGVI
jgi:hypothetical protein